MIKEIDDLHEYIKNELKKEINKNYSEFTIIKECFYEDGLYVLIKNLENIEKIIGIIPINSNSIYSFNEKFKVEDFTDNNTHFIHDELIMKKPIIVCDEQGGILIINKNGSTNIYIKNSFIIDNYDIDYQSFYNLANSQYVSKEYSVLTDKNKVIEFLLN